MTSRPRVSYFLPLLAAAIPAFGAASAAPPGSLPLQDSAQFEALGTTVAAVGRGQSVSFVELKDLLIWRFAQGQEGRSALREVLELQVLGALAEKSDVQIPEKVLRARWNELDSEVRAAGEAESMADYLAANRVQIDTFRHYLELAIVHETLARRGLGLPADAPITSEQQSMWLEGEINNLGYTEELHPYAAGIVAHCGPLDITRDQFAAQLVQKLSDEVLNEACFQLLLEKCVLERMPDLSADGIAATVEAEIGRRRVAAEANPKYDGLKYEALLGAQGLTLDSVRHDPAIRVAALSRLWLERSHSDDALRDVYAGDRPYFDGLFGEGVEIYVLLLKAARYKNELNPRTFDEADVELTELGDRARGVEDFMRIVKLHSEDPISRENGGRLGVVTRATPLVPEQIRNAAFKLLDSSADEVTGQVLGPIHVQGASAMLCLGQRRRAPLWANMKDFVETETRRRFLDERLLPSEVTSWLQ
ncbi:MAG: hypothetical protein ACI8QZ_003924 [Chlamydiales bacterium]|jgi:hypothetical protein